MPGIARTVSLTEKGRQIFVFLFRSHTALIQRAFQGVFLEEVNTLTRCALKRSVNVLKVLPNGKAALTLDKRGSTPM